MNKLKVFLSSRVNSAFNNLDGKYSLKDLRQWLREQLETEAFLGEQMLDIIINETDFNSTIAKSAFVNCMDVMRSSNIIVIMYNGEAGWAVSDSDSTNGMCHEEFLVAVNDFSDMTFAMDLTSLFTLPKTGAAKDRNEAFKKNVEDTYGHMEKIEATTIEELKTIVLRQIKKYILTAIEKSFATQKSLVAGSTIFGDTLDWSKSSYSERQDDLEKIITRIFGSLPPFADVIKAYHGIPDNMSVAEARSMIGRPFIHEQDLIVGAEEKSGVIHFVGVYGNATEIQVKSLVGYPDLTVIKTPFGFYLWEKNVHIQMFFLKNCINPQTVKTRLSEVTNWLLASREQSRIIARANARFSILDAINKTKSIVGT